MPLLSLWTSNPAAIEQSSIEQVVAIAGDGMLKDGSSCSQELRDYLTQCKSIHLGRYVDHCLSTAFNRGGMVLQDLVNELGRRLDYRVENGRYQGTRSAVGYDGIWVSPEGHTIITEVKTTDAYRISLDTIAEYRRRLTAEEMVLNPCSILIVVGRDDTGELEAQIRGSRHAWDVRLISTDALVQLVRLKENSDSPDTGRKIRGLLVPMEYTRLDNLIDVLFTTAADVEAVAVETAKNTDVAEAVRDEETAESAANSGWEFTDLAVLDNKRGQIVDAVVTTLGVKLIKKSRALFWDANHETRIACSISKRYIKRSSYPYWYAYHPQWHEFLQAGASSHFVLGCMDLAVAFAIPLTVMQSHLDDLNTTTTERSTYWHVHLIEGQDGGYALLLPKRSTQLSLNDYAVSLAS